MDQLEGVRMPPEPLTDATQGPNALRQSVHGRLVRVGQTLDQTPPGGDDPPPPDEDPEQDGRGDLFGLKEIIGQVLGDFPADKGDRAGVRLAQTQVPQDGEVSPADGSGHVPFAVPEGEVDLGVADISPEMTDAVALGDDLPEGSVAGDVDLDPLLGRRLEVCRQEGRSDEGPAEGGGGDGGGRQPSSDGIEQGGSRRDDDPNAPVVIDDPQEALPHGPASGRGIWRDKIARPEPGVDSMIIEI
jgi:hypothetical protein